MRKRAMWVWTVGALAALAAGCSVATEDGEKFREPIPTAAEVSLSLPGAGAAQAEALSAASPAGAPAYAKFYLFTRNVMDGVDAVTGAVLGSLWLVVHSPPSSITDREATWGPGSGDALSPAVWRLRVTEVDDKVFDYRLEGRPKASTDEQDYRTVLAGRGYGKDHPQHKTGWFSIDNDAARELDPARNRDHGKTKITHQLRSWPASIAVEIRPTPAPEWLDLTVTHEGDGAGVVDVKGSMDIEEQKKDGRLEDVTMHNRWAATGAGRADVRIEGGSVPSRVDATECWSTSFARTYYTDNAGIEPTTGDPASCVFPPSP